jgi:hypothetical protein
MCLTARAVLLVSQPNGYNPIENKTVLVEVISLLDRFWSSKITPAMQVI